MFLMYAYDVFFSNDVSNFIFSTNHGQWENIWINLKLKSYTFKVLYISQPTYQSSLSNIFQLVNYLILAYTEQNLKQEKECLFFTLARCYFSCFSVRLNQMRQKRWMVGVLRCCKRQPCFLFYVMSIYPTVIHSQMFPVQKQPPEVFC